MKDINWKVSIAPLTVLLSVFLISCTDPEPTIAGLPEHVDYNWDVRPILSDKCFQCHGNDEEGLKAGLRLNIRETALDELPESPGKFAIVEGDSENSELMHRITSLDADVKMPPESSNKSLTTLEIEILRRWIDQGAEYKEHWAFISPTLPEVPETLFENKAINEIDNFVLAQLEEEGLSPSEVADKEDLINRVYLTLTGLPPSIEAIDSFVDDDSPDAYDRLVDQLLDSPRYAEHMASYWMDLARWSESDGYLDDHHDRYLWPWRDWVINSFQENMPFNQFGTWQLAGDLLPNPTKEQILATAYLRVGKRTTENGAIEEEYKAENMVERTDNALGTALMGLTLGCARCHDHRFDPISQVDYYSYGAFFNSNDEPGVYAPGFSGIQGGPTLPWPTPETEVKINNLLSAMQEQERNYATAVSVAGDVGSEVQSMLNGPSSQIASLVQNSLDSSLAAYYPFDSATPATNEELPPARTPRIPPKEIASLGLPSGNGAPPPSGDPSTPEYQEQLRMFELAARIPRGWVVEEMTLSKSGLEGAPEAVIQSPIFHEGIQGQALFFDENNRAFLGGDVGRYDRTDPFSIDLWFYANETYESAPILNHRNELNGGATGYSLSIEDGYLWVQLAHSPPTNMIAMKSVTQFPVQEWTHLTLAYDGSSKAAGTKIYINGKEIETIIDHDTLTRTMVPWNTGDVFESFVGVALGSRFRVKAPVAAGIDELRYFNKQLTDLEVAYLHNGTEAFNVSETLEDDVREQLISMDEDVVETLAALTSARQAHNEEVSVVPQVLVMRDLPEPAPTYVLNRGLYSSPGEQVYPRGMDNIFAWDDSLPENRLGLAQWLFDDNHPLTARVFVNRMWQMHFSQGIVETSEDFGSQGSIPSHPDLLDYLTVQFVQSGWDVKALHKMIVSSATYKQSSFVTDELLENDARNKYLARGPSWRMTAEMVRDQALSVSGLLTEDVGGKSVMPYQPEGIWNSGNSFYAYPTPESVPEDEHHRRTLYTFVKRNAMNPSLSIFDFTNRTESKSRRSSSNTPLQALDLMNDPQFVEAYRSLATLVLKEQTSTSERLTLLYRLATRSTPNEAVINLLNDYYLSQQENFSNDEEKIERLLSTGVTEPDSTVNLINLAAMTNVAALVMNSPDAYTVQ